ncbi:geranylgeranylglyceryl phosphate synthase family protein [Methanocella conradii HZ254]|uniref:Geranylgeranylglyceryl phosphate synthase n=1 Tax=Methanocella conradii (strain DSM 24694 / JCM 17849 / CGMCC 1.5162 / HZ254) TaxID=1041930 RepID=H8I7K1_METCZ|nr:phosphoglycerol geranylgeranyltransferase [Methanocella conradii]AFD01211.1 geranylgeranylglyceryl phosphate synthase family protein [Methanocella conradii HZ254]
MIDWRKWRHVTKLDPDKPITPKDVAAIVDSGTDAIMLSGTQNITRENVASLADMLKDYDIPKVLEPSNTDGLREDVDFLFVPSVLNTDVAFWFMGAHRIWVQNFRIDWEKVVPEAYIVLNPKSAVARVTKAKTDILPKEAAAYAECADRFFHFPIVYVEYSGTYGDPEVVKAIRERLHGSILYYGGGINSRERALEMSRYASTIVVGNLVYEPGGIEKLKETIVK